MKKGEKAALAGVGVAGAGGLIYVATKKKPTPPPPDAEPDVAVSLVWDGDVTPEFAAGSTHIASITVVNPSEWGWRYRVEFYFGDALEKSWTITLPPGYEQVLKRQVVMPIEPGQYTVGVDIYVG
jgi:hypothetical protein